MSIGKQVREAVDNMAEGDSEQALIAVVIAAAATSKRIHQKKKDKEAFQDFVKDNMGIITGFALPTSVAGLLIPYDHPPLKPMTASRPLEEILYNIRCHLLHEAMLPENVQITDNVIGGKDPILLPSSLITGLIAAVVVARVNRHEVLPPRYVFTAHGNIAVINDFWGKRQELQDWMDSVKKN
jgi:hypothetical protein